ncbi:hypothetical protein ID866_8873 [Astraeus odoratus]|nr:hypothetical protein ID866_8873 [Astraeus odoratus]
MRKLAPINYLPSELFLSILDFAIHAEASNLYDPRRVQELAMVSRRWRDTIHNFPMFWTTIILSPQWSTTLVETHVQRSRNRLLDIRVLHWNNIDDPKLLRQLLRALLPCASRWCNFIVEYFRVDRILDIIVETIESVKPSFPSLIRFALCGVYGLTYPPQFLKHENVPSLEELVLSCAESCGIVQIPPTVSSLYLEASISDTIPTAPFSISQPSGILTTLTIWGYELHPFPPNSLHFPSLKSLTFAANELGLMLDALVAPQLSTLCYRSNDVQDEMPDGSQIVAKFPVLYHFQLFTSPFIDDVTACICDTFPAVRHLELPTYWIESLFSLDNGYCFADEWEDLQLCEVYWSAPDSGHGIAQDISQFVSWLEQRRLMGKPMLHVRIRGVRKMAYPVSVVQNALQDNCILELEGVNFDTQVVR